MNDTSDMNKLYTYKEVKEEFDSMDCPVSNCKDCEYGQFKDYEENCFDNYVAKNYNLVKK